MVREIGVLSHGPVQKDAPGSHPQAEPLYLSHFYLPFVRSTPLPM